MRAVSEVNRVRTLTDYSYPKMKPTMDITAAVLLKESLLASHADGSGNVSRNHS